MAVALEDLPEVARRAWTQLRDGLKSLLGEDLVAIWGYGGAIGSDRPLRPADLDTHVIVRRRPDELAARRIQAAMSAIADREGVEWDTWFIVLDDARRSEPPPHAFLEGRRDTSWALHRAHWLAGRYLPLYGARPVEVVTAPTWAEIEGDLDREVEHVERHVLEGDADPYEASYAILNGCRIAHAVETRDVVLSKRAAGQWALEHLPGRWNGAVNAALRAYDGLATPDDDRLLAGEMAPFVAMVRERLPTRREPTSDAHPRWSGY